MKERGRGRGEKRTKQTNFSTNNCNSGDFQTSEQGFHSDSSASTISDSSVNNIDNSKSELNKIVESKAKKGDYIAVVDNNSLSTSKVSSTCTKETLSLVSDSLASFSEKQKKTKELRDMEEKHDEEEEEEENEVMEVTASTTAKFDFDDLLNGDSSNTSKNQDSKKNSDKKRNPDATEEPDKKKAKHSR